MFCLLHMYNRTVVCTVQYVRSTVRKKGGHQPRTKFHLIERMVGMLAAVAALCFASQPASAYLTSVVPTLAEALAEVATRPAPANESGVDAAHAARLEVLELRILLARVQRASEPPRRQPGLHGSSAEEVVSTAVAAAPCGDCFGAGDGDDDCCNTCEDVMERYHRRGWGINPATVAQCNGNVDSSGAVCGEAPGRNGDGQGLAAATRCAAHLACHSCVADGCGWCISQRACRPDEAWQCQGDVDHIGLGGIGKHTTCPSPEAVAAERRGRQQRVEAEEQRAAKQSTSRSCSNSGSGGGATLQALEASVVAADAAVVEAQAMLADAEASFAAKSVSTPKKSSKKKKSYYADPDEVENENENDHVIQDAAAASAEGSIEDLRAHVAMLDANARAARQRLESMVEALASQPLSGSGDSSSSSSYAREKSTSAAGTTAAARLKELKVRAQLAEEGWASTHPYETLGVLVDPDHVHDDDGVDNEDGAHDAEDFRADSPADVTQGMIRRAYRRLSLRLHPDKARSLEHPSAMAWAETAFAALVAAYDVLGSPDKRAAFDDFGDGGADTGAFETEWEFERFGRAESGGALFFSGHPLITTLTENLWEKRVGRTNVVWVVKFYAPWCSHCQRSVELYKEAATAADDAAMPLEFGAVNCVNEHKICSEWFGIRAYPTFLVINDKHGTRQEYLGNKDNGQELVEWASTVAKEWTWLFRRSAVTSFADPAHFSRTLLSPAVAASSSSSSRRRSTSATSSSSSRGDDDDSSSSSSMLWLVLFTDGVDCQPCKTAKTNLMRVSAGLYGLPASVGLVDCTQPAMAGFCYGQPDGACNLAASSAAAPGKGEMQGGEDWVAAATAALPCHALPEVPHAPVLKAFVVNKLQEKAGKEKEKEGSLNRVDEIAAQLARILQGEMLYNNNEIESHLALQLVEKTARSALASLAPRNKNTADSTTAASAYTRNEPEDDDSSASDSGGFAFSGGGGAGRPELLWNGPSPRAAVAWGGGGGGGGHSRPAIGR